jgi:hypothetical protein
MWSEPLRPQGQKSMFEEPRDEFRLLSNGETLIFRLDKFL